ncbi:MAG: hypothetical protein B6I24_08915 [Bacteroidetes bacterium 4572_128]|nr:MAG: hypothetical protein B6I24_08915 [Bacteroidetes bacterium 4572_128]
MTIMILLFINKQIDDILYKIELYSKGEVYEDVCTNKDRFFSSCDYYLNGVGYLRSRCVVYDRIRDVPLYDIGYRPQQSALISTINYEVYHYMYEYEKEKTTKAKIDKENNLLIDNKDTIRDFTVFEDRQIIVCESKENSNHVIVYKYIVH